MPDSTDAIADLPWFPKTTSRLLTMLTGNTPQPLWPVLHSDPALSLAWLSRGHDALLNPDPANLVCDHHGNIPIEQLAEILTKVCQTQHPFPNVKPASTEPLPCNSHETLRTHLPLLYCVLQTCQSIGQKWEQSACSDTSFPYSSIIGIRPYTAYLFAAVSHASICFMCISQSDYPDLLIESDSLQELRTREQLDYGYDHLDVARDLIRSWKLPETWSTLIQCCQSPTPTSAPSCNALAVHLNYLAESVWKDHRKPMCETADQTNLQSDNAGKRNLATLEAPPTVSKEVLYQVAFTIVQLNQLNRSFETSKLDSLAEFAAAAGHEINNPLAVISGQAQLLLTGEPSETRRRSLLTVAHQASRINGMISDLMLFARPPEIHITKIPFSQIVSEVVEKFQTRAGEQNKTLNTCLPNPLFVISADALQMKLLIGALIENALDATESEDTVRISVPATFSESLPSNVASYPPRNYCLVLEIQDTGTGLSETDMEHLFDPFYSGRSAGRGLGLGLSKCWRIVQNHDGQLFVKSPASGGCCVQVYLPVPDSVTSSVSS